MKGTIFIQLLEMAEDAFGEDAVDDILDRSNLASGGAYTSVGTYSCGELVTLVLGFSEHSGLPADELQRLFGHWMMKFFVSHYPSFFEGKTESFEIFETIENEIHVEVRKLYNDVELPTFAAKRMGERSLELIYTSPRPLAPFCHGLIEACAAHFNEDVEIASKPIVGQPNSTAFDITVKPAAA